MNRRRPLIVSDDIPAAYLHRLLGKRLDPDTVVFSRSDAVRAAEAKRRRNPIPEQHHPHGRSRHGRAVR